MHSSLRGHGLDLLQKRSVCAPCAPAAPWHSSWRVLTKTRFGWWGGGEAIPCSATSTPWPKVSHQALWRGPAPSALFPQVWASFRPLLGSSWGPGTGLVRIWQIKHALSHHQAPVALANSNNYRRPHADTESLATIPCQGRRVKTLHACALAHKPPSTVLRRKPTDQKKTQLTDPPTLPSPSQAWHRIGDDSANKTLLITPSGTCSFST